MSFVAARSPAGGALFSAGTLLLSPKEEEEEEMVGSVAGHRLLSSAELLAEQDHPQMDSAVSANAAGHEDQCQLAASDFSALALQLLHQGIFGGAMAHQEKDCAGDNQKGPASPQSLPPQAPSCAKPVSSPALSSKSGGKSSRRSGSSKSALTAVAAAALMAPSPLGQIPSIPGAIAVAASPAAQLFRNDDWSWHRNPAAAIRSGGTNKQTPVWKFFVYNKTENLSRCIVGNCTYQLKGPHTSTLACHLKKHAPEYAEFQRLKSDYTRERLAAGHGQQQSGGCGGTEGQTPGSGCSTPNGLLRTADGGRGQPRWASQSPSSALLLSSPPPTALFSGSGHQLLLTGSQCPSPGPPPPLLFPGATNGDIHQLHGGPATAAGIFTGAPPLDGIQQFMMAALAASVQRQQQQNNNNKSEDHHHQQQKPMAVIRPPDTLELFRGSGGEDALFCWPQQNGFHGEEDQREEEEKSQNDDDNDDDEEEEEDARSLDCKTTATTAADGANLLDILNLLSKRAAQAMMQKREEKMRMRETDGERPKETAKGRGRKRTAGGEGRHQCGTKREKSGGGGRRREMAEENDSSQAVQQQQPGTGALAHSVEHLLANNREQEKAEEERGEKRSDETAVEQQEGSWEQKQEDKVGEDVNGLALWLGTALPRAMLGQLLDSPFLKSSWTGGLTSLDQLDKVLEGNLQSLRARMEAELCAASRGPLVLMADIRCARCWTRPEGNCCPYCTSAANEDSSSSSCPQQLSSSPAFLCTLSADNPATGDLLLLGMRRIGALSQLADLEKLFPSLGLPVRAPPPALLLVRPSHLAALCQPPTKNKNNNLLPVLPFHPLSHSLGQSLRAVLGSDETVRQLIANFGQMLDQFWRCENAVEEFEAVVGQSVQSPPKLLNLGEDAMDFLDCVQLILRWQTHFLEIMKRHGVNYRQRAKNENGNAGSPADEGEELLSQLEWQLFIELARLLSHLKAEMSAESEGRTQLGNIPARLQAIQLALCQDFEALGDLPSRICAELASHWNDDWLGPNGLLATTATSSFAKNPSPCPPIGPDRVFAANGRTQNWASEKDEHWLERSALFLFNRRLLLPSSSRNEC